MANGNNKLLFLFQALHFFYGLGAFLTPMIAKSFLLDKDCTAIVHNITHHDNHEAENSSEIQYAFWILSGLQVSWRVTLLMLLRGTISLMEGVSSTAD